MASASSTSTDHEEAATTMNDQYDVFLCFKGPETRHGFTGTLYNALCRKKIRTFMDSTITDTNTVKVISQTDQIPAVKALEGSRISIVVLSANFPTSSFCLDLLVKILERAKKENSRSIIVPIFYRIDPSHVRHQTGLFGDFFSRNYGPFGTGFNRLCAWRSALTQVANIRESWHFQPGEEYEYERIENIVQMVADNLPPRYHVFLSFSEDTRYSFTDYLYDAFDRERFETYMKNRRSDSEVDNDDDDDEDKSQDDLLVVKANIEKSRVCIIVFSENYADSSECLDELVMVLDSMKNNNNQLVWPIFYNVKPSDIRHQRESYGKAMIKHENKFGKDYEKLQTWRLALFQVANLKGWPLNYGYEYDLVEKLVKIAHKI